MPSAPRKPNGTRRTRRKEKLRRIYVIGAIVLVVIVGIGLYVNASYHTPNLVYAKLNTSMGTIEVELYQGKTPKTVTNFVNLAKSGFFDNLVWHRIVKGFVIQTGDPNSRNGLNNATWGQGGSPQTLPLEIDSSLHNDVGYLGVAHSSDPNSGSSQFYINLANNPTLDGSYTVFGKVITGMDTALAIGNVPVYTSSDQPISPVFLTSVSISDSP